MKRDVILSAECGTSEFLHKTMALTRGPMAKLKQVVNNSPRMFSLMMKGGIQMYRRVRKLVK